MQNSKPAIVSASRTGSESGGLRSENLVVVKALFGFFSSAAAMVVCESCFSKVVYLY